MYMTGFSLTALCKQLESTLYNYRLKQNSQNYVGKQQNL